MVTQLAKQPAAFSIHAAHPATVATFPTRHPHCAEPSSAVGCCPAPRPRPAPCPRKPFAGKWGKHGLQDKSIRVTRLLLKASEGKNGFLKEEDQGEPWQVESVVGRTMTWGMGAWVLHTVGSPNPTVI